MKSFLVIGLGRFGTPLAMELCKLGHEVLAVDVKEDRVQAVADQVTHVVTGDARDPEVLRTVGAGNFDCAVVAAGGDVGNSALIVLSLKELGVPRVVGKAHSEVHRRVLEKIGADLVVYPEREMAVRLAQNLSNTNVLNYIELSSDFSIVERHVPQRWLGKSLAELNIRAKYHVTIIAVRDEKDGISVAPGRDYVFHEGDNVVALGKNSEIERMETL